MWIITEQGFYSIVHKPHNQAGELTIRCRVKADLERFCQQVESASPISEDSSADYRYRVTAPRKDVAVWLSSQAENIEYSNFKSRVYEVQGALRERIYAQVWGVLLGLKSLKE